MPKACKVTFNDETFYANCGDLLLDGALMSGVEIVIAVAHQLNAALTLIAAVIAAHAIGRRRA